MTIPNLRTAIKRVLGAPLQALQMADPTERKLIAYFCATPDLRL